MVTIPFLHCAQVYCRRASYGKRNISINSTKHRKGEEEKITYPVVGLVVSGPVDAIPHLKLLPQSTVSLLAFVLENCLLLMLADTDHTSTAVSAGNNSTVEVAASGLRLLFFNFAVFNSKLLFLTLAGGRIVVEVLTVVFGKRAMADAATRGEMQFVVGFVDDGGFFAVCKSFFLILVVDGGCVGFPAVTFFFGSRYLDTASLCYLAR